MGRRQACKLKPIYFFWDSINSHSDTTNPSSSASCSLYLEVSTWIWEGKCGLRTAATAETGSCCGHSRGSVLVCLKHRWHWQQRQCVIQKHWQFSRLRWCVQMCWCCIRNDKALSSILKGLIENWVISPSYPRYCPLPSSILSMPSSSIVISNRTQHRFSAHLANVWRNMQKANFVFDPNHIFIVLRNSCCCLATFSCSLATSHGKGAAEFFKGDLYLHLGLNKQPFTCHANLLNSTPLHCAKWCQTDVVHKSFLNIQFWPTEGVVL